MSTGGPIGPRRLFNHLDDLHRNPGRHHRVEKDGSRPLCCCWLHLLRSYSLSWISPAPFSFLRWQNNIWPSPSMWWMTDDSSAVIAPQRDWREPVEHLFFFYSSPSSMDLSHFIFFFFFFCCVRWMLPTIHLFSVHDEPTRWHSLICLSVKDQETSWRSDV